MSLRSMPLEDVAEEHLRALVEEGVAETHVIEYKRELPGGSDAKKKEFLADVASFVNSGGGDLVCGVAEEGGVPIGVPGFEIADVDAEINKLENSVRGGIEPRVEGLGLRPIPLSDGRRAMVLRVPRSAAGPHVVAYQNHWKFYSRATSGKFQMNYDQVRRAFLSSGSPIEDVKRHRDQRLGVLRNGEAPIELGGPLVVLHLVPLSALDSPAPTFGLDLGRPPLNRGLLRPVYWLGDSPRHNSYGLICEARQPGGPPVGYVQLFRTGAIEAADRSSLRESELLGPFIASEHLERSLIEATARYLELQRGIGVEPPVLLLLSLVGAWGHHLAVPNSLSFDARPMDRDEVKIGPLMIEDLEQDRDKGVAQLMRPLLDEIWNACGLPRSPNFDESGRWFPRP